LNNDAPRFAQMSNQHFGIVQYVRAMDVSSCFWLNNAADRRIVGAAINARRLALRTSMGTRMNGRESVFDLVCERQMHLAERELCSFVAAVTEMYGPEQARLSAEDWLDEADLRDDTRRSEIRDWRSVTIAASARLASRVAMTASTMERSV
jgi:hypothetical protein